MKPGQDRPVRVLYMIGSLGLGGAEGQLVQLIRHLDRSRFEPLVACMSELGPLAGDLEKLGVPVHLYGLKGLRDRSPIGVLRALWEIAADVRRRSPDIVHAYLFWANVLCGLMSKLGGAPILMTSRRGLGLFKDGRRHYQWIENVANLVTDIVTVNSRQVEDDVHRRESFVGGKTRLIYNGVDWRRYLTPSTSREAVRRSLGVSAEAPLVGCVANLIPYKGHADLIEAFALTKDRVPGAHLALVGRDDGIQAGLEELVASRGLTGNVHFLGSRRDVADLLHAFDLQVLASHEEGFSNVLLEGMAAGRAIVATNVGGNAEAVLDGKTGLIVPSRAPVAMAYAIAALLTDSKRRAAMEVAARERVQATFSMEAMVGKVEALYTELLIKKRGGTPAGRR